MWWWLLLFFFSVVEFKDEEFVKKAVSTMNKHDLNGRPLNIKEVWIKICLKQFEIHFISL